MIIRGSGECLRYFTAYLLYTLFSSLLFKLYKIENPPDPEQMNIPYPAKLGWERAKFSVIANMPEIVHYLCQ